MKTLTAATLSLTLATVGLASAGDFSAFDLNGDRFVSYEELLRSAPGVTRSDFNSIDQNGDRRLSSNEFLGPQVRALVTRLEGDAMEAQAARSGLGAAGVAQIDVDGDGLVSFDELYRADVVAPSHIRGN